MAKVQEAFLVNPAGLDENYPKGWKKGKRKRRKKKEGGPHRGPGLGRIGSAHQITAITGKGRRLYTSKKSRLAKPHVRINPYAGLGETALVLGANPKVGRKISRRVRSNPAIALNIQSIMNLLPYGLTAGAAAILVGFIPRRIGVTSPWARIGTKAIISLGGGIAVGNIMKDNRHGLTFATTGLGLTLVDLINILSPGLLGESPEDSEELKDDGNVGVYPVEMMEEEEYDLTGVEAYPEETFELSQVSPYDE